MIRLLCPGCEQETCCPVEVARMFVCRDDRKRNKLGFDCERCGPMLTYLGLDGYYELQMVDVPVSFFTLADVAAEQAVVLREFTDSLDHTLEQILAAS